MLAYSSLLCPLIYLLVQSVETTPLCVFTRDIRHLFIIYPCASSHLSSRILLLNRKSVYDTYLLVLCDSPTIKKVLRQSTIFGLWPAKQRSECHFNTLQIFACLHSRQTIYAPFTYVCQQLNPVNSNFIFFISYFKFLKKWTPSRFAPRLSLFSLMASEMYRDDPSNCGEMSGLVLIHVKSKPNEPCRIEESVQAQPHWQWGLGQS